MHALIVLFALLGAMQLNAFSQVPATNLSQRIETPGLVGPFFITQNSSPSGLPATTGSIMDDWVVPILKYLAWPGIVVWIVWFFGKEIRGKLEDLVSVKGGEKVVMNFATEAREQQKASVSAPSAPTVAGDNLEFERHKAEVSANPLIPARAATILKNLKDSKFTEAQQIELGALVVAELQGEVFFWRIYNFIFGSQITLLQELNSRPLSDSAVRDYFDALKSRQRESFGTWSLETYLEFLKNHSLVEVSAGQIAISTVDRESHK